MHPIRSLAPFHLTADDVVWVETTPGSLTPDERVGQLFNLGSWGNDPAEPVLLAASQPGGVARFFGTDADHEREFLGGLRAGAKVPPLLSADLEGSRMSISSGTEAPNPLALAAIDDGAALREIARIMAEEAVAPGLNWSFNPVLDINAAFRSAIVATRGVWL